MENNILNGENSENLNQENSSFFDEKVSSSNSLEPHLRFKCFKDKWLVANLEKIFKISAGGDIERKNFSKEWSEEFSYPVYANALTNSGLYGFANYYKVEGNSITVTGRGDVGHAIARYNKYVPIVRLLTLIPKNKINVLFFENAINSTKIFVESTGVPQLTSPQLGAVKIHYPYIEEQDKIAAFLSLIDERIAKQRQLVENLKKYKRGLLTKIFRSKNNNWDCKKLGELCDITTGKLDANAMKPNGQYRFYTCAKEFYFIDEFAFDTEALLVSGNGANVGYIHHYNGKFNAYQRTYVLDKFKQNIIFVKYYLETFLHQRIESEKKAGNTPYIVLSTLSDLLIKFPSLDEQNRITTILSEFDLITQKQESLLKQDLLLKQGLLQQMFI